MSWLHDMEWHFLIIESQRIKKKHLYAYTCKWLKGSIQVYLNDFKFKIQVEKTQDEKFKLKEYRVKKFKLKKFKMKKIQVENI